MAENLLVIISDHLSTRAVGACGETAGVTPHLDSLAAGGTVFGRAYTACPLCMPSRASIWTGRLPHETGVTSNGIRAEGSLPAGSRPVAPGLAALGEIYSAGGWETVHFGKTHDSGTLKGFEIAPDGGRRAGSPPHPAWRANRETEMDNDTVARFRHWLAGRESAARFCAVVSLRNPHNICAWVGDNRADGGPVENIPPPGPLPPLPDNFETPDIDSRPLPVRYLCCSHDRLAQAARWTPLNYRHYIAAYLHYASLADRHAGQVLGALRERGLLDRTLVVVLADHGDAQGSHRMVTKQVSFCDEVMRVPLIFRGPGVRRRRAPVTRTLVSLLDLLPTLCDYSGLPAPAGLPGRSLVPTLRGRADSGHRAVFGQWHTEWGYTVSPGRMVRARRFKYTHYLEGGGEELFDLENDPGERFNLAREPNRRTTLVRFRKLLREHVARAGDPYFSLEVRVDSKWRAHAPGYPNHRGPAAPSAGRDRA